MPDTAPELSADLPVAPRRTRRIAPGLSTGVVVVAALCFLALMGSGTAVLVETLRVQQASWDEWPVARRYLTHGGKGAAAIIAEGGDPSTSADGTSQAGSAYLFDVPVVPGEENTARGQLLGDDRFEQYLDITPPPATTNQLPEGDTFADQLWNLQNKRRVGDRLWMLTNPNSPFSSNVPLTPGVQRQLKLFKWWEDWAKAGYPEEVADPEEYAAKEKEVADIYEKVMAKRRKLKGDDPSPDNPVKP